MNYLERNVDELLLQGGVLVSAVFAAIAWCLSNSANAVLSTYILCMLPALLVVIPDWSFFMRPPTEWSDVVFVEPMAATTQIRKLALERDMKRLQASAMAEQ